MRETCDPGRRQGGGRHEGLPGPRHRGASPRGRTRALDLLAPGGCASAAAPAPRLLPLRGAARQPAAPPADRLAASNGADAAFDLLDAYFGAGILESPARLPQGLAWAWSALEQSRGRLPVGRLADTLGWSRKRLAREFRLGVGLTPKTAARLRGSTTRWRSSGPGRTSAGTTWRSRAATRTRPTSRARCATSPGRRRERWRSASCRPRGAWPPSGTGGTNLQDGPRDLPQTRGRRDPDRRQGRGLRRTRLHLPRPRGPRLELRHLRSLVLMEAGDQARRLSR